MALTQIPIELSSTPSIVDGGNATAITIDSSENVGIGTGTASLGGGRRFTVAGGAIGISGQNTSHSASSMVLGQDSTAISQIRFYGANTSTAGILQFMGSSSDGNVGGERMRIDSSGQVGIGTTAPTAKLDVYGNSNGWTRVVARDATTAVFTGVYKTASTSSPGVFAHTSALDAWEDLWINGHNDGSGGLAGGTAKKVIIAGNVGIGVSPVSKLDIASGNLTISNSTNAPFINFVDNTTRSQSLARIAMDQVSGTAGQLLFSTTTGGSLAERMRIDSSGDVSMPNKAYAYGTINGNPSSITNNYGIALTTTASQNCTPQTNSTHGPGITITKAGFYTLFAQFLYDPDAVYIYGGWAVNGTQIHHWHSNHAVSNNHDAVSSIGRYLNVGDHVTIENSNQAIATIYGNAHSSWYIAKIG